MKRNSRVGGLTISDLKLLYNAAIINNCVVPAKKQSGGLVEGLGTQNIIFSDYSNPEFDKPANSSFWGKNSLFEKNYWENWKRTWQKISITRYLTPYIKI